MKLGIITLLSALAVSCGGSAEPAARVATAASPTVSFDRYHTFSMGLVESSSFNDTSPRLLEEQSLIRDLIVSNLESKGYAPAARQSPSDILVRFASAGVAERVPATAVNPDNHETVYEKSLQIDVFDSATGLRAWHGVISIPLRGDHGDPTVLERSVAELLNTFPAHIGT